MYRFMMAPFLRVVYMFTWRIWVIFFSNLTCYFLPFVRLNYSDYVSLYMFGFNRGFPVNRRVRFEGLKPLKKASKIDDLEECYEVLFHLHQNFRRNSVILH